MSGRDIGYVRVSSVEQNSERQLDGIKLHKIFTDKCSGKDTNRPQLTLLLEFVREGDILCMFILWID
ncbi:MAG: transposase [Burkholderiales bacterium]|jgi:DNA invertase Pin-like site-specific DNA recombinase|nr:transposase [Burkholderiales bacterium]